MFKEMNFALLRFCYKILLTKWHRKPVLPTIGKNNGVVVIVEHIVFQDKTCTVAIILVSHELVLTSLF